MCTSAVSLYTVALECRPSVCHTVPPSTHCTGPVLAFVYAVKELLEECKSGGTCLPANVVFLIEGEEENVRRAGRSAPSENERALTALQLCHCDMGPGLGMASSATVTPWPAGALTLPTNPRPCRPHPHRCAGEHRLPGGGAAEPAVV